MTVEKIISGGQDGADAAGLFAAKYLLSLKTGGTMPKGFRTDSGNRPEYAKMFGVVEHSSRSYPPRTEENVKNSDGTVIFGDHTSPGCSLTMSLCEKHNKPLLLLAFNPNGEYAATPKSFREWLERNKVQTLNVAGNRERKNPGIFNYVRMFLLEALK